MLDFDWYQGTLSGVQSPDDVVSLLLRGIGAFKLSESPGGFNRPYSVRGSAPGGGSLGVYFGNGLDVHVVASSWLAAHACRVLRREFPTHRVSRADVAYDVDEPGAFDRLYKAAHALARAPRRGGRGGVLATSTVGDWLDGENGRTLYIGAPSSALRIRIYEKGHEQRAKHPDQKFSPDWVRVEWQIRPNSAGKSRAATASAAELAAWTRFGADMLDLVAQLEFDPTAPARIPSTDPLFWMVRQYGVHLRELVAVDPTITVAAMLDLVVSTPHRSTAAGAGTEFLPARPLEPVRG